MNPQQNPAADHPTTALTFPGLIFTCPAPVMTPRKSIWSLEVGNIKISSKCTNTCLGSTPGSSWSVHPHIHSVCCSASVCLFWLPTCRNLAAALFSTHMHSELLCNAPRDPTDVIEMPVGVSACVISKLSICPTFALPMLPITPVTAVNMRVSYQVSLMAKQAAPAPKHTTSHLLCTLFCLYTTHLFTLVCTVYVV